jgi:hypothetical protein
MVAADLGHPLDHAAAQALAAVVGSDEDLERAEDGRSRRLLCESGLDDSVDSSVGQARHVSVPRSGDRVPDPDDLVSLLVPRVELELGEVADHPAEELVQDRVVVHELGPRALQAGCVWLASGELGARREAKRHLSRSSAAARPPARRGPRRGR